MADPSQSGKRIRPLARRLDSLSGSPTNSNARAPGLPPVGPRSGANSPLELGPLTAASQGIKFDSQSSGVKSESTVKDILAHARKKEMETNAKKDPGTTGKEMKGPKAVIHMNVSNNDRLGYGAGNGGRFDGAGREGFVGRTNAECCPMQIPFESVVKAENNSHYLCEDELVLFQVPSMFPTFIPTPELKPDTAISASSPKKRGAGSKHSAAIEAPRVPRHAGTLFADIPDGRIGTVKVRKSGKMYLEVGGVTFEITPGQEVNFRTEVACLCPMEEEMIFLGEASKRLIVSPVIS